MIKANLKIIDVNTFNNLNPIPAITIKRQIFNNKSKSICIPPYFALTSS